MMRPDEADRHEPCPGARNSRRSRSSGHWRHGRRRAATAAGTDYFSQRIPRPVVTPPGRVAPQHAYLGDAPAFGHSRCIGATTTPTRPGTLAQTPTRRSSSSSMRPPHGRPFVACESSSTGHTSSSPGTVTGGRPDLANVIGWQVPASGVMAETHFWTDVSPPGDDIIVDADILLSPTTVTNSQLLANVITHEWGHVIGLGHSPVADTLMSGPPGLRATPAAPSSRRTTCKAAAVSTARRPACRRDTCARCPRRSTSAPSRSPRAAPRARST